MSTAFVRVVSLDGKAIPSPAEVFGHASPRPASHASQPLTGLWSRPSFRATGARMMNRLIELKLLSEAGMRILSGILDERSGPVCLAALDPTLYFSAVGPEDAAIEIQEWVGRLMDDTLTGVQGAPEAEAHVWAVRLGLISDRGDGPAGDEAAEAEAIGAAGTDDGSGHCGLTEIAADEIAQEIMRGGPPAGGGPSPLPSSLVRPGVSDARIAEVPF